MSQPSLTVTSLLLQTLLVDFSLDHGVFTFRVFKEGKWQHVTVDDRLPASEENQCIYAVGVDNESNSGHAGPKAGVWRWGI